MKLQDLEKLSADQVYCLLSPGDTEPTICILKQVVITKDFVDGKFRDTIICNLEQLIDNYGVKYWSLPLERVFIDTESFYEYLKVFVEEQISTLRVNIDNLMAIKELLNKR